MTRMWISDYWVAGIKKPFRNSKRIRRILQVLEFKKNLFLHVFDPPFLSKKI